MIDSPEEHCGRHHVCRGIWGGVRHPLFFWLVWQHIPGGPLHASSPASAVLARPWRCDLGRRHCGMLLPPTLSAREVGVACLLDCPRHPHRRVRQATAVTHDNLRAPGGGEVGGAAGWWGLFGGAGDLARPGKGVPGLYGNVMGDCVTAVRPHSCRQAHHRAC